MVEEVEVERGGGRSRQGAGEGGRSSRILEGTATGRFNVVLRFSRVVTTLVSGGTR